MISALGAISSGLLDLLGGIDAGRTKSPKW
jgi:hypothetical protein